ncbi:MAG: hypothetical protein HPY83_11715 [Anaerolineae bacterium]|nr:hypothetical protein [Anaerolineae bacterium]
MNETGAVPSRSWRRVLGGVPRVAFYGEMVKSGAESCPEDMTLPSCLRSLVQYLGEPCLGCRHLPGGDCDPAYGCGYAFFMGVSGQGFMLNWNAQQWEFGSGNALTLADDAMAPVRWALEAVGYRHEDLGNAALDRESLFPAHADEATLRARIIESIEAGRPVLGFGVVGPPECCLITGYDEGGDVITGWSFFQGFPEFAQGLEFEPEGYFRKREWFGDTLGVVVITGTAEMPDLRETYRKTLAHGLAVMREGRATGSYTSGTAAFDAWMNSLLRDEEFASAGIERLRTMLQIHNDEVGNVAECRHYCADFLDGARDALPAAADELGQAAGCFRAMHDLMWRVWEQLGGHPEYTRMEEEPALQLARPEARRRVVEVLRVARERQAEAAAHVEAALGLIQQGASVAKPRVAPRAVLEGVPYVGFDASRTGGRPENTYMCAAMKSALTYIGEPCSYEFLMGVSGAAFRLAWHAERWDGGNISTLHMGDDPTEHYRRAFRAVGWDPSIAGNVRWRDNEPCAPPTSVYRGPDYLGDKVEYRAEGYFRERMVYDIRFKRYPMLAIGVVFPPECGVVTGYDEGGEVLIGWNHFQHFPENAEGGKVTFEPGGQYRKRDWFEDTVALIAFHYKTTKPPLKDSYRRALEWAVKLGRTARFGQYYSGLAAYEAWAAALEGDDDFAAADDAGLALRLMCHNDAINCLAEGRRCAAAFLRDGARVLPQAAEPLEEAARRYLAELDTLGRIVAVLGGMGWDPSHARSLARPEARQQIVPLIREARAQDEEALSHLERVLEG